MGSKYIGAPPRPIGVGFCRPWPVVKCRGRGSGGQKTLLLGLGGSNVHSGLPEEVC